MQNSDTPIRTFREGPIGASIWRRRGANGDFFEFSLSRSYKRGADKSGYSNSYRIRNASDLIAVIGAAVEWIQLESDDELNRPTQGAAPN